MRGQERALQKFGQGIEPPAVTYDANGNILADAHGRSFTLDFENCLILSCENSTISSPSTISPCLFLRRERRRLKFFCGLRARMLTLPICCTPPDSRGFLPQTTDC
jgi:hypothetical protein